MALSAVDLSEYLGLHIKKICPNGYWMDADNHCAHFVAHMLGLKFGYRCGAATGKKGGDSVNVRVHEIFGRCDAVGAWSTVGNAGAGDVLAFVTKSSVVHLSSKTMDNIPKKHIGIYVGGQVWHYSNSHHKVVQQTPEGFSKHYAGDGFAVYWGTAPK